jgi:S-adenosylmethionine uptake transporter
MQAFWMLLATLLFATMGVGVKFAAQSFNVSELVFYRGLISVVFTAAVMRASGTPLRTPVLAMQAWRTLAGTLALGAWFYAIAHLPLATAVTLNYMSSVWMALFVVAGAVWVRMQGANGPVGAPKSSDSQRQGPLALTVLAAFVGVVMLLRPTIGQNQLFAGIVGLLSGIGAALAYLQVNALARAGEPATRTVFYFAIGTAVGGLVGMLFMGVTPWASISATAAWWIVPIGVLATVGQWCMTRAFSQGPTLVAANLQYSGIVFAAFYGVILFGDLIPWIGWVGMALIVASGIAATALRNVTLPDNPQEPR